MMKQQRTPHHELLPIHPGEILLDDLDELNLSGTRTCRLSRRAHESHHRHLKRRKRAIAPDTALRIARYFGTSAECWLNL